MGEADLDMMESAARSERFAWRRYGLLWGLGVLISFALMWDALYIMVRTWWVSATFQHVMLILPVLVWLVWQRRQALADIAPRPFMPGLVAVLGASALWFAGFIGDVIVVQQFGLVFMLQALTLTILGVGVTRALLFPLAYMILLIPFGEGLIPPLQDITAVAVVEGLRALDIPVFIDGTMLMTPSGDFTVAEACSGVRYLISTVALGALFANIAFKSWVRRLAIMAVSVVMPIIANAIRAFGIVYVAYLTDNEYAAGVDHIVYGWVFFAIVTVLLLVIGMTFADRPVDDPPVDMEKVRESEAKWRRFSGKTGISYAALGILVLTAAYGYYITTRVPDQIVTALQEVEPGAGWTSYSGLMDEWRPRYVGADVETFAHYDSGETVVSLYRARYNTQSSDVEMITYGNTAIFPTKLWDRAQSSRKTVNWGGREVEVITHQINGPNRLIRDVWQVYWVNDKVVASELQAKAEYALARMTGGELAAGTIVISAPRLVQGITADAVLGEFVAQLPPVDVLLGED